MSPKITNKNPEEWKRIIELTEQMQFGEVVVKVQNGRITLSEFKVQKKQGDAPDQGEDQLLTLEL